MIKVHEANKKRWNVAAHAWAKMHDERGTWRTCHRDPKEVFTDTELHHLGDLRGKQVCVLGSGDNLACFALAGLGANVTSVDISEVQLEVAAERAKKLALDIAFVQADVCDLSALAAQSFHAVYTGGHVAVWVSDLPQYYREAARLLRNEGVFIVNEYHPFRRVWKQGVDHLVLHYDYYDRGPFQFQSNAEIMGPNEDALTTYEFHWSVSDFINAIVGSGLTIIHAEEFGDHVGDWEGAPLHGLPEFMLLVSKKH